MTTRTKASAFRPPGLAFSITELLVVLAVASIIIALLLPAYSAAREQSQRVVCQSNLRQITLAMIMYAQHNQDRMPATALWSAAGVEHDWIHWQRPTRQLRNSAIARYLHKQITERIFRCPSDNLLAHPNKNSTTGPYLYSYSMNVHFGYSPGRTPPKVSRVRMPSQKILMIDEEDTCIDDGTWMMSPADTDFLSTVHDPSARVRKQRPTSGQMVNPKAMGVVSFLDGHVGMVSKRDARDPRFTLPN
ncbi:MAG: type II secretion system GspH family protein [Phycisphaerae bacterium]|nr:type II secretion system GspH family protein [Phycisphaerae bacterium]MDW8262851.1 type II secretion system protein [Phycisphaerales bacterium]